MKTLKDIKNHPAVKDAIKDSDGHGYIVELKKGYTDKEGSAFILSTSLKGCAHQLKQIKSTNPVSLNKKGIETNA